MACSNIPDLLTTLATCSGILSCLAEKPDDPLIAPMHGEIVQTLQNIEAVCHWCWKHIDEIEDIYIRDAREAEQQQG